MPVPPSSGFVKFLPSTVINPYFNTNKWQLGNAIGTHLNPPAQATDAEIITFLQTAIPPANKLGPARTKEVFCAPATFFTYAYYATSSPNPPNYALGFTPTTRLIWFNDNQYVDYFSADYPPGLMYTSINPWFSVAVTNTANLSTVSLRVMYNGSQVGIQTYPGAYVETNPISVFALQYGISKMMGELGFELVVAEHDSQASACGPIPFANTTININYWSLRANYSLWSTTLGVSNPDGAPGSEVVITDGAPGVLDKITDLKIEWLNDNVLDQFGNPTISELLIPRANIISQSKTAIRFLIPSYDYVYYRVLPYGGKRIRILALAPTEFTGWVSLALLNAILVDSSGVYTIVPDKRNDTYYDRSVTPSTTIDLKIPDPYLRTGYFNE